MFLHHALLHGLGYQILVFLLFFCVYRTKSVRYVGAVEAAKNMQELLGLNRTVQGVILEFFTIDMIMPRAQQRILSNVSQTGRSSAVRCMGITTFVQGKVDQTSDTRLVF